MINLYRKFLFSLFAFFLLVSCAKEDPSTTVTVVIEQILYTSSENLRLLGRLITNQQIYFDDHGFYVSEDENFTSPIIISLGSKNGPGRFIGETDQLTNSKTYFAKPFFDFGENIQFGEVIQLKTLSPTIKSFTPKFGTEGDVLTLFGTNLSKDSRVFFGDREAEIISITDESSIAVKIPSPGNVRVPIRLKIQNLEKEFPVMFEYKTGVYELISKYPDPYRLKGSIFYVKEGSLFFGLGNLSLFTQYPRIKKFIIESNTWFDVPYNGPNRSYGFFTENYVGGGTLNLDTLSYNYNNTFFELSENGYKPLDDLTFVSRESVAFEIEGALYIVGSLDMDFFAVRKYNPIDKSWSRISQSPVKLTQSNPYFVYQKKLFIVDSNKILWEFDPSLLSWKEVSIYPGDIGKGYGMGQVIGGKAYIGLYNRTIELWELDMSNFSWKPKRNIPGSIAESTVAHFSYGGYLYFIRTPDRLILGNYPMNLYKFDPYGF